MLQERVYQSEADTGLRNYMTLVYTWMSLGLLVTGIVALLTVQTGLVNSLMSNQIMFFVLIFGQLGLVIFLSSSIMKLSPAQASGTFILYSALNGLTLSMIFILYTRASIASTFFITAGTFGAMSLYGLITKRDLTNLRSILFMGLIGIIIASLVNIFLKSPAIYWAVTIIGVLVFTGLTAYDTQKIKNLYESGAAYGDNGKKIAIIGALRLYLDFINLFLMLLRIFGRRN